MQKIGQNGGLCHGSKRLTPTIVGKIASKHLLFLLLLLFLLSALYEINLLMQFVHSAGPYVFQWQYKKVGCMKCRNCESLWYRVQRFRLLDGDKLATLLTGWLSEQLRSAHLDSQLRLGLVQTAYANSASTTYSRMVQGVEVLCASTGVKHLHALAERSFDIGVYFEANGHGTVLYSEKTRQLLEQAMRKSR